MTTVMGLKTPTPSPGRPKGEPGSTRVIFVIMHRRCQPIPDRRFAPSGIGGGDDEGRGVEDTNALSQPTGWGFSISSVEQKP